MTIDRKSDGIHRRHNPLADEWVVVSPHRNARPWQGSLEPLAVESQPEYVCDCYLCPGNQRANAESNPAYESTYVFANDFPALVEQELSQVEKVDALFHKQDIAGECRVTCFSPKHNLTLAEMPASQILDVVQMWISQFKELSAKYKWVQIFENKGSAMGCSNQHPHGQIWAGNWVPSLPQTEDLNQKSWHGNNLILDTLDAELRDGNRIVEQNQNWIFWVPFWAKWPYEGMLAPRRHVRRISELTIQEQEDLSQIMHQLLVRYDNLFSTSFPYSMGWHGAPSIDQPVDHWQLHAHFYPPLLRSASVKKFMVGYEMLAESQRDITPEQASEHLRSVAPSHYKNNQ